MTHPDLQSLAQVLAERQINAAVAGVALAFLVWTALRFGARQNSGARFAIWSAAMVAIVAFPFFSLLFPFQLPQRSGNAHGGIVLAASWALYLFAAWGVGASLLLVRLGIGLWRVRSIRGKCTEIDPRSAGPAVAEIVRAFSSCRRVSLCTSTELTVPAALGLFRPAIVFPEDLLSRLSPQEIEMIVRHEMAHLERWDDWTNLAQKIVKAVFFFHPAVWWIESRLTLEREMACDDIVLSQTGSPRAYASSLISFAEKLHSARGLALAQALVSRMHQMSLRVAQILDANRPRHTRVWKPVFGMSLGLLAVVFGAAPYMPRLVAFEQPSQKLRAAAVSLQVNARQNRAGGDVVLENAAAQTARWHGPGSQAKAISASFNTQSMRLPLLKAKPVKAQFKAKKVSKPMILRATVIEPQSAQPTIYVWRTTYVWQTTVLPAPGNDGAGLDPNAIWTLCIWRVDVNNPADRRLESAIVLSLI